MAELRDLALFVAVVENGSITAGADAVGLSLAAASARVKALERTYGADLLRRGRRGVAPTASGTVLLDHARRVLGVQHDLERDMLARRRGLEHVVHLEANSSAVDALTEMLAAALAARPDTAIVLHEARSTEALSHVADGTADLAVVSDAPDRAGLMALDLWTDPLVVVGGRGVPAGAGSTEGLTLGEVVAQPMIGLAEGSPLQALIEEEAARISLTPSYRLRMPSLSAVCAVASTGAGLAIVPAATAHRLGMPAGATCPLDEAWARRRTLLVARDFAELSEPVTALVRLLRRHRHEAW